MRESGGYDRVGSRGKGWRRRVRRRGWVRRKAGVVGAEGWSTRVGQVMRGRRMMFGYQVTT